MKKMLLILALAMVLFGLSGCIMVSDYGHHSHFDGGPHVVAVPGPHHPGPPGPHHRGF